MIQHTDNGFYEAFKAAIKNEWLPRHNNILDIAINVWSVWLPAYVVDRNPETNPKPYEKYSRWLQSHGWPYSHTKQIEEWLESAEGENLRMHGWHIEKGEMRESWHICPPGITPTLPQNEQQQRLIADLCEVAISAEDALFLGELGLSPTYALADYCDILRIQRKRNQVQP